jgi:hypothetical protein
VADQLTTNGFGSVADQLTAVADSAFVSAVHWGVVVAAMATAVGVVIALVFLPARPREEDREVQEQQYAEEHAGDRPGAAPVVGTATEA